MNKVAMIAFIIIGLAVFNETAKAQPTTFAYQGSLHSGGSPANGNHDFEFALFDAVSGGTQIGSTQTVNGLMITNGGFSATLDFGAQFPGANRFLEIRVRPSSGGPFTTLSPRQAISSTPYAVRSLSSGTADAVAVAGVPAGSGNYIQNQNFAPQASTNFFIQGNGTAVGTLSGQIVNAGSQFDLNGMRFLSTFGPGFSNTFAGIGSGQNNFISAGANSFFGNNAGFFNTSGQHNSFFGFNTGQANTFGSSNSFFGSGAGGANTSGSFNSFFGINAGNSNSGGSNNSFFGNRAGDDNTGGGANSFFGESAGVSNTNGDSNSFFGNQAGATNISGSFNTAIGRIANFGSDGLNFATAIGARAQVTQSNSLVLGAINGINGATSDTNVGIGTTAPTQRLHVVGNGLFTGNLTVSGALNATLPAGSASYIQNTASPQSAAFNISGNGTVGGILAAGSLTGNGSGLTGLNADNISSGTLNNGRLGIIPIAKGGTGSAVQNFVDLTTVQTIGGNKTFSNSISAETMSITNALAGYQINGSRVLSTAGTDNFYAGAGAGQANSGSRNAFFGYNSGWSNTANDNSFFGWRAGYSSEESVAHGNAFFGAEAGRWNDSGAANAFFGLRTGDWNLQGSFNSYFGAEAGPTSLQTIGSNNTLIGARAGFGANNLNFATAIGADAVVSGSNTITVGRGAGQDRVLIPGVVGIGTTAPERELHVAGPGDQEIMIQSTDAGGRKWTVQSSDGAAAGRFEIIDRTVNASRMTILADGNVGIGITAPSARLHVNGTGRFTSTLGVGVEPPAGATALRVNGDIRIGDISTSFGCVRDNGLNAIAGTCSSDLRLKKNVRPYGSVLSSFSKLRPVTFDWRADEFKERDLGTGRSFGLIAQEVEELFPELVDKDKEGMRVVNYSKLPLLTIQAIKEQQAQIESQQKQIHAQSVKIEELKRLVCASNRAADICKE